LCIVLDDPLDEDANGPHPSLESLRKDALYTYDCTEVFEDGTGCRGELLLTSDFICMVRKGEKKKEGNISLIQSLFSIVKITSKKKTPGLITLTFGEGETITRLFRVFVDDNHRLFVGRVKELIQSKTN